MAGFFGASDTVPEQEELEIWSTKKVDQLMSLIETGGRIKGISLPFHDGNPQWRKGNIVFNYTPDELEEIKKCASDITYFAENYCTVMTDDGLQQIKLRDYQFDMLRHFVKHRFTVTLASRQIGKCFLHATSIYIKKDDKEFEIKLYEFCFIIPLSVF